jgi:hypothetical protein
MSHSNYPIPPAAETIKEWLAETNTALVQRRDELLAGYKRFLEAFPEGIPDETVQGRAADFAGPKGMMNTFIKECDNTHDVEKKPYIAGGKVVDAFFGSLSDPVERCQKDMRVRMRVFADKLEAQRREEARLEAERLAREAALAQDAAIDAMTEEALDHAATVSQEAEEAAALAQASAAELSRTRGELGTVVSLRTRWVADFTESDLMTLVRAVAAGKAPLDYLTFNHTRIGYAVRSEKVRQIPGVAIKEERSI